MAVRPIDANELYRIEKLLDTDIVRQDKVALNLLEQVLYDIQHVPALTQPNEPLTQADIDSMDYDKVWIDYGDDGEWALVVSGRIYALAVLEGAGFEGILRDEVGGEIMDRPSGNYTVYRRPPEAKDNNVPTNEPLTIEQLREMNGEPVWIVEHPDWGHWELSEDAEDYIADRDQDLYGLKHDDPAGQCGLHVLGWLAYRRPPEGEEDT